MLNQRRIVVVIPAFREEAHVAGVLATLPRYVDHAIVVDDGSDDRTGEEARRAGRARDHLQVQVLRHPVRRGVGAALVTGYRAALELTSAGDDAIAVMAGDGQMHPDDLEQVVLPIVHARADYIKGTRFGAPKVRRTMGLPRWLGGQVFSRLTSLAIGHPVTDSQCGFTALSRRAAAALDLADLWPSFGYPNDLLGQLAARGARIAEVPVQPIYGSEISKLRLRHLPPIFFLIGRAAVRRAHPAGVIQLGDIPQRQTRKLKAEPAVSS